MKSRIRCLTLLLCSFALTAAAVAAQEFIVKNGEAQAEIVIADNPAAIVTIAANELQEYIGKISGAQLPIRKYSEPASGMPVTIYVGNSPATDRLGMNGDDLEWGAYRIRSGDGWFALVGNDTVFEPQGLYARNRRHWADELQAQWDEATGGYWENPVGAGMWTNYNSQLGIWQQDEKGTINAVYGYLRSLGVEWYMIGEEGEIVPRMATIPVPSVNEQVDPDFSIRMISMPRYHLGHTTHEVMHTLRLGFNRPYGRNTHHGIARITRREEVREQHPEWFALYNNERQLRDRTANHCLSSEGLFEENLRFARFMFDMYDVPVVDVMPDDGFTAMCQCELCEGKDTPERGRHGVFSDYVWDYVNRIATEIAKSHPGKYISCGAYSTYWLPPEKVDKMSPNVVVYIVNGRRRFDIPDEDLELRRDVVRQWKEKTGNPVIIFMNHSNAANTPRIFAEDIQYLKENELSMGEDIWPPATSGELSHPGFNHLNHFIVARYMWDASSNIDDVLGRYYTEFYGPAAKEMEVLVNFYERRQRELGRINSVPVFEELFELFDKARAVVDPDSIYGRRIAMFNEGLQRHRTRYEEIKAGRVGVPTYTASRDPAAISKIKIDGVLDEPFWQELPGTLKELRSGGDVAYPTTFKIGVDGENLYIGILCKDEPGQPFNAAELEKDDSAMWFGDIVEIILESPEHSYYQIAVNPMGSVADLDREDRANFNWDAQAEIAVHRNEEKGYWSVEARIPFTSSTQDPLHEVVGTAPSADNVWYFNICRQRLRNDRADAEYSAYSPTGAAGFHHILKFARLTVDD